MVVESNDNNHGTVFLCNSYKKTQNFSCQLPSCFCGSF